LAPKLLILLAFALFSGCTSILEETKQEVSLQGNVMGIVIDNHSRYIDSVTISLSYGNVLLSIQDSGRYIFSNVNAGTCTIKATKRDFLPYSKHVEITGEQTLVKNILLEETNIFASPSTLSFGLDVTSLSFVLSSTADVSKICEISSTATWSKIDKGSVLLTKGTYIVITVDVDRTTMIGGNGEYKEVISIITDGNIAQSVDINVAKGYITLSSPTSSVAFAKGTTNLIHWETNSSTPTTVWLYKNNILVETIADNVDDKSIFWTVKESYDSANDYKIKVQNGSFTNESDNLTITE